LDFIRRTMKKS